MVKILTILIFLFFSMTVNSQIDKKDFDLKELPSDWVKLTKTDSGLIIYNTCDAGNRLLSIRTDNGSYEILLHGLQEDYHYDVLNTYQSDKGLIVIKARWKDSDKLQDFSFKWTNKSKGIGIWETEYFNNVITGITFTTQDRQLDYPIVDQPCVECWDDECEYFPIEIIRRIFEDYVKYNESTDSEDDKIEILENIKKINYVSGINDYLLLINVWMYYDPTDFAVRPDLFEIFKRDIDKSTEIINYRIDNPKEWENDNSAPYSELKDLIIRLKNE